MKLIPKYQRPYSRFKRPSHLLNLDIDNKSDTVPLSVTLTKQRIDEQKRRTAAQDAQRQIKRQDKKRVSKNVPRTGRTHIIPSRTNSDKVTISHEEIGLLQPVFEQRRVNPDIRDEEEYRLIRQNHYNNQELLNRFHNEVVPVTTDFMGRFFPSTIIGAIGDKNKSFVGSMVEGNRGLGEISDNLNGFVPNLIFNITSPAIISKGFNLFGKSLSSFIGLSGISRSSNLLGGTPRYLYPNFKTMTRDQKIQWLKTQLELAQMVDLARTIDVLHLTKSRLKNGGFDRLRSAQDAIISRGNADSEIRDFISKENEKKILSAKPIKGTSSDVERKFKLLGDDYEVHPTLGGVGSFGELFTSLFNDAPSFLSNFRKGNRTSAHEFVHYMYWPNSRPKALVDSRQAGEISDYLWGSKSNKGGEVAARGTEIKNYFGLKEGEPITPEMWDYARRHYASDVSYERATELLFDAIHPGNMKIFLSWLNRHAPAVVGTGVISKTLNNE